MQEFDNYYNNTQKEDKSLKIGSFFFGIFSIICSFSVSIFMLPFSIIGLILGVLYKKNKNHKDSSGITLNVVAMVLSIIIFIVQIFNFVNFIISFPDILMEELQVQEETTFEYDENKTFQENFENLLTNIN